MNCIWWNKLFGGVGSALTPEFTISRSFSFVVEESKEIMDGIDRLLLGASRQIDSIGILYSPESIVAAYTSVRYTSHSVSSSNNYKSLDPSNIVLKSARSFFLACQDLGYTPTFISEDQIKGNELIDSGFSLLFLPYSQAVSRETVELIKEFAQQGGTIIADVRPAVMDENLSMRVNGALDELFGITQEIKRIAPEITGTFITNDKSVKIGIPSGLTIQNCSGDPTVSLLEGTAAFGNVGNSPALIMHKFGKGKGFFLNFGMELYEKVRSKEEGSYFLDIIQRVIETSGIELPFVSIIDKSGNRQVMIHSSIFNDNIGKYIGLLTESGSINNQDSREKKCLMRINFSENIYYVYDVRNKSFLGAINEVPIELISGRPKLYALLPYRVKNLIIKVKDSVVTPGDKSDYSVTIETHDKDIEPGRHVVTIRVIGPDGKEKTSFTDSIEAVKGNFESTIWISENDPPGRWILRVRDIATGKKSERAFIVKSNEKALLR